MFANGKAEITSKRFNRYIVECKSGNVDAIGSLEKDLIDT